MHRHSLLSRRVHATNKVNVLEGTNLGEGFFDFTLGCSGIQITHVHLAIQTLTRTSGRVIARHDDVTTNHQSPSIYSAFHRSEVSIRHFDLNGQCTG